MSGSIEDRWYRSTGKGRPMQTTQYRKGLRYRVRYRQGGRAFSKSFAERTDAELFLAGVQVDLVTGSWVDPQRARMTVGQFAPTWLATTGHGKRSTRNFYDSLTRTHVLPRWADRELGSLSQAEIAAWVGEMRDQMSASRTRHAFRALSLLLDLAVSDKRLSANPAKGVKLPKPAKKDKRYLTREELEQMANSIDDVSYRALILLLGLTGLRFGEAIALCRRSIVWANNRISVTAALAEDGGTQYIDTPKSHERRMVAMPPELTELLAHLCAGKRPGDLIFTAPKGGSVRYRNFRRDAFDGAAAQLDHESFTPHDLRHTAASLAVAAGADVKVIQKMLGHASAAMTLDIYADLFDSRLDDVSERMSSGKSLVKAPESRSGVSQCVPARRLRVVKDDHAS